MHDLYLHAPDEATLLAALPAWLRRSPTQPLSASHRHALDWNIGARDPLDPAEPPPPAAGFLANLRLRAAADAAAVQGVLAAYVIPAPALPRQSFA